MPGSFKAEYPAIEWVKIQRMRTMVADADAGPMQDDFVWETLRSRIPGLLGDLGVDRA